MTAGCCGTPRASGSCSTTCRTCSASSTRRPRRRPTAGTPTRTTTGARRSCCPATRSPGRSTPRSRPGAGRRTAACSWTSPPGGPAEEILRKLPSMYHQFKELADVDITKEPMEVGPTCHYVMGGVEVDPDTARRSAVPGLFAAGEVSGGMHGSNRLGGNSLSDLLVFGRRAGWARCVPTLDALGGARPVAARRRTGRGAGRGAGAAAAHRRREPVHGPRRGPADHERPGRHHPARGRAQDGAGRAGEAARAGREGQRRRAARPTTRAGTWPWTCATSCWSPSAWRRRRWSGRRAAAGTPARTSPAM